MGVLYWGPPSRRGQDTPVHRKQMRRMCHWALILSQHSLLIRHRIALESCSLMLQWAFHSVLEIFFLLSGYALPRQTVNANALWRANKPRRQTAAHGFQFNLMQALKKSSLGLFFPHSHQLNSLCVTITYNIAGEVVFLEYLHILFPGK